MMKILSELKEPLSQLIAHKLKSIRVEMKSKVMELKSLAKKEQNNKNNLNRKIQ